MSMRRICMRVIVFLAILGFFLALPDTGWFPDGQRPSGLMADSDVVLTGQDADKSPPLVVRIFVDGSINPITANYIVEQLVKAEKDKAGLLILQLDTPGGLMSSMRQIVKAILASPVPVAVYVAPSGARAASAGVFITLAAPIAVMAPGTTIGAAHPVTVGGGGFFGGKKKEGEKESGKDGKGKAASPPPEGDIMATKILNDTVAFIRSIAAKNGRNVEWAERAVRESISSTGTEAVKEGVVDFIAPDVDALLKGIEGMEVTVSGGKRIIALSGARIEDRPMGTRRRILAVITDPNVAYLLMLLGIFGIFFELVNPGVILPGVLGGISIILAFFSFQLLPVNYAGVLLILFALVLFVLEVKVVSFGMLTVGGILSLVLGSLMFFNSADPYYRVSLSLIFGMTGIIVLIFVVLLGFAVRIRMRKVTTGIEGLIGEVGVAGTDLAPEGKIMIHGEIWSAVSTETIKSGEKVKVTEADGLSLKVKRVNTEQ